MLRWLLAALHLTALGIGLGAVWVRAGPLRGPLDPAGLRRIFAADSWWALAGAGVAALTLMACYGAPPCEDGSFNCYDPETPDAGTTDGGADAGP